MSQLNKIQEESMTLAEMERDLHIIETQLVNASGETRELRLKKKLELKNRIDLIKNAKPEDIIVIDDNISIVDNTAILRTVKAPRTANEILAERVEHKFTSSLYRETVVVNNPIHPMQNVFLGLSVCY